MVMKQTDQFMQMSVSDLLGRRLNDVETKYAPKTLYAKGKIPMPLPGPRVSIVGSRKASQKGLDTANTIAKKLTENHVVIVSGLAEGIDTAAHKSTINAGGKTIAVIGTPLNKVYPQKNASLQEQIMQDHLVVSQYEIGHTTTPKDFVLRNRTMALISDATIIVEADDSSGSLHQGWEALRLGRPLFVWASVLDDTKLVWPKKMLKYGAMTLENTNDVLDVIPSNVKTLDIVS